MAAFTFGLITLLFLSAEELLAEAHEKPETSWVAAMFSSPDRAGPSLALVRKPLWGSLCE